MRSISTIIPIYGIAPTEALVYEHFAIVSKESLPQFAELRLGYRKDLTGFDLSWFHSADAYVICTARTELEDLSEISDMLEAEITYFTAVLSAAFWIHSDLHRTLQLSHEAYTLRGSSRLTIVAGSRAHSSREEHVGRGHSTLTYNPPLPIGSAGFKRMLAHPFFKPAFECLLSLQRTELCKQLLNSIRSMYFAYSANTGEGQLVGAITSIDALLYLSQNERNKVSSILSPENSKVKNLIRSLIGEQNLNNVIRFHDKWHKKEDAPLHSYNQRNKVVHDGELTDYSTVVDSYRLALRVIFSVAQIVRQYESRTDLVVELDARFDQCWEVGGAAHVAALKSFGFAWVRNGMPDFLPFVISRFYRLQSEVASDQLVKNTRSAMQVIMHQRGVAPIIAYRALQQISFRGETLPPFSDVSLHINDQEELKSSLHFAVHCRAGSPLAWIIYEDELWKEADRPL